MTNNTDWIKHDGKGCPVHPETLVKPKLRINIIKPYEEPKIVNEDYTDGSPSRTWFSSDEIVEIERKTGTSLNLKTGEVMNDIERLRPLVGRYVTVRYGRRNNPIMGYLCGFNTKGYCVVQIGDKSNKLLEYRPSRILGEWQEPKKRHKGSFWVNFYEGGPSQAHYLTKEGADGGKLGGRIACIEFPYDFEEGEGL